MSSPTQARPVVTLYPSAGKDVNAYLAAIRLASAVRNGVDAPKAGVDAGKVAVNADSYGRHHPDFPAPTVPIYNQTTATHFASSTTKPGSIHPRDGDLSPSHSMSTAGTPTPEALRQHHGSFAPPEPRLRSGDGPTIEKTAAYAPAGVKTEALEQHHGQFLPPEPLIGSTKESGRICRRHFPPPGKPVPTGTGPIAVEASHGHMLVPNGTIHVKPHIGSTQAPPRKPTSRRTGPIPIEIMHSHGGIPPECQFFATNTDVHNVTFAVCPAAKSSTNLTHNLASRQPSLGDISNSRILAIRNTATCEAPTGFDQRLACGQFDGWLVLAFFIILSIIGLAWLSRPKYRTWRLDEEAGNATWPQLSTVSTNSCEARPKSQALSASTNRAEARLREKIRNAHEEDQVRFGAQQYESVAWRSASRRAILVNVEGRVEHDAGPVAMLPELSA